ncbi:MAG: N-acetyltransferase [Deltaproteobacteria bacterium]|nr:MAG: N-acetyltransferase [Deltaproteobacteria bacterium]
MTSFLSRFLWLLQVVLSRLRGVQSFRRWLALQDEQGRFVVQHLELGKDWAQREYGFAAASVRHVVRLKLTREGVSLAQGDLMVIQRSNVEGPQAWLYGIEVHPLLRRGGLGRLVTQQLLELAEAEGWSKVWLSVNVSNRRAKKLYKRLGFERVRRPPKGEVLELWRWQKDLSITKPSGDSRDSSLGCSDGECGGG